MQGTEKVNEAKTLRKLARLNKYDIKAVLWNPHMAMHQLVVSTVTHEAMLLEVFMKYLCPLIMQCQQKLDVWDVDAERHPQLHSIKAHTRPVW